MSKKGKTGIKFIAPLPSTPVCKKEKGLNKLNAISMKSITNRGLGYFDLSPTRITSVNPQSKFTSIYNNYHLIYSNFLQKSKEPTKPKKKFMSPNNQLNVKKKKIICPKRNGLTLLPSSSIDSGIICDKLKAIVTHSVIANRRMEYSEMIKAERSRYIRKVVIIQRQWRKYQKKLLTHKVKIIQRIYRKQLERRKTDKTPYHILKFEYLLLRKAFKKCMNIIKEYGQYKINSLPNEIVPIENTQSRRFDAQTIQKEIKLDINAEVKEKIFENSLKMIYDIDPLEDKSVSKIPAEFKSFPRPWMEMTSTKIRRNRKNQPTITEDSDENANSSLGKDNDEKVISKSSKDQLNNKEDIRKAIRKDINNERGYYTKVIYKSNRAIMESVKAIQQCYHLHLLEKQMKKANDKFIILFCRFLTMMINYKLKLSFGKLFFEKLLNSKGQQASNDNLSQEKENETIAQETEKESSKEYSSDMKVRTLKNNNDWKKIFNNMKEQILNDTFTSFSKATGFINDYNL